MLVNPLLLQDTRTERLINTLAVICFTAAIIKNNIFLMC